MFWGSRGGGPSRVPLVCGGHISEGGGHAQLGEFRGGPVGGKETPSIFPNTKPESSPDAPYSCEEGLLFLQFGVQKRLPRC